MPKQYFLSVILFLLLPSPYLAATETANNPIWQQLKTLYFADRPIRDDATDLLFIEVPSKIEDAAIMPITIKSLAAQTTDKYIKTLYLIVDNNPQPYSAVFHLSPKLGAVVLSTRIRMDNFSNVRVIAELNDNSLHMVKKFVVASGGCSAPASKDREASIEQLGKIQIRISKAMLGETTTAQVIIRHPNNSGMQFDSVSQAFIPAHYVTNIAISYNDYPLITAETGITLSENPSIRFNFIPHDKGLLKVTISDSNNQSYQYEKPLDWN